MRGFWEDGEEASVFYHYQLDWQTHYFRTPVSYRSLQLPRKAPSGKLWLFQLTSAPTSEATTHLPLSSPLASSLYILLEQLAHRLQEAECTTRMWSFKYQGFVFRLLILASNYRGPGKRDGQPLLHPTPIVVNPHKSPRNCFSLNRGALG